MNDCDIVFNVAIYLPIEAIGNLCQTCKRFYQVLNQNKEFWKQIVSRDFGEIEKSDGNTWRIFYRQLTKILITDKVLLDSKCVLIQAMEDDYYDVCRFLLSDPHVDPSISNNSIICWASGIGNIVAVDLLLKDPRVDPTAQNNAPIRSAAKNGHIEAMRLLLADGRADPNYPTTFSTTTDGPALFCATGNGHAEIVEMLLKDPRVVPFASFLDDAAYKNHHDIVKLFVADGRTVTDDGFRAICYAGYTELVRQLIIDPRIDPSDSGNAPFHCACQQGHTEIVKLLIADHRVNPADVHSCSLISAGDRGHTEIVRLLLADGRADPTQKLHDAISVSSQPSCVIMRASANGHAEVVELLLTDPRVDPTVDNNASLQSASVNGHTKVVRVLIADPRVDPSDGDNYALRRAIKKGHIDVVRLLLQALCRSCSKRVNIQSWNLTLCPSCGGREPHICKCGKIFMETTQKMLECSECQQIRDQLANGTINRIYGKKYRLRIIYENADGKRDADFPLLLSFKNEHLDINGNIIGGPLHLYEREGYKIVTAQVRRAVDLDS